MLHHLYRHKYVYLLLAPAVVFVFLFHYVPLFGWVIAFTRYQPGLSMWDAEWAGLEQFRRFFVESNDYLYLLRNTLVINILIIITNLSLGLIFAVLLNELRSKFFMKLMQTVSFFPFFISWVITYSISYTFLSQSTGVLNNILVNLGFIESGINVLGEAKYAWPLAVGLEAWKSMGYTSIIFIAAITAIPPEQYEAADIDGASRFQKMRLVTIPNLVPTLIVILILNSGWVLSSNFEFFFIFTNPTNWERMQVLDIYIYDFGLKQNNYSYATAVGIVKTVVSLIIIVSINALSKRATGKGIF